jgi:ribosomal protein S17E
MDIKVTGANDIEIYGNITTLADYQENKRVVAVLVRDNNKRLKIHIKEAFSITSSVIGFFLKLVYQDGIDLSLEIADERLVGLLEDLRLSDAFNVRKV